MDFKNVTVAGGGTMGAQISWQIALNGYNVIIYDPYINSIENCKKLHLEFAKVFLTEFGTAPKTVDMALSSLSYSSDLEYSFEDANLVCETIPEIVKLKKALFKQIASILPQDSIITTNTSTTLPSEYLNEIKRPENFLALHFCNKVWEAKICEIMGHPGTDETIFERIVNFVSTIGLAPIPLLKEQRSYVVNSLLVPFLCAAGELLVNNVADPETIDKAWMMTKDANIGPFGIIDKIGMQTLYNVERLWGERNCNKDMLERAEFIHKNYIEQGKMGISTGEGFYKYPNPKYREPDFMT